ncbi:MAG TPA: serine hydrolase domain-containing protein [Jatrophihabitans sp.]|nr:serine hydrolase domain-containing protein [Jatrophihabitans sp.]
MTVHEAWQLLDDQLAAGRFPGFAAGVRHRGEVAYHVGGTLALDRPAPVTPDSLFRIASLTKPVGAALVLNLVEHGLLSLDDPVARWLPELAAPRVLRQPDGDLTDTVPAERPILVRDLLAFTAGFGLLMADTPLQRAIVAAGLRPGPTVPELGPDEFAQRLGALPLAHQPGARWMYHTGSDAAAVLVRRLTGRPVGELLAERVTGPLGLTATGYHTRELDRLTTHYLPTPAGLQVSDPPDGRHSRPPAFESLGNGLVSSVADYLAFLDVFTGRTPVLGPATAALMVTDGLTAGQRAGVTELMGPGLSWGLGLSVQVAPDPSAPDPSVADPVAGHPVLAPGRYGWNGGSGVTAYVDPSRELAAVLFTPRMMAAPRGEFDAFWAALYRGIDPTEA